MSGGEECRLKKSKFQYAVIWVDAKDKPVDKPVLHN
jgi:hypothetical protein